MTDILSSQGTVSETSNRYIVGPAIDLHLPLGLGVEFDILYRRFGYGSLSNFSTSSSSWEFPLLVKKQFLPGPAQPFVDAGVNFNKLTGLSQQNDFTKGFTMGAGVDFHVLILHIAPELRYTRWGSQLLNSVLPGGTVSSNQNQAEFLVGFRF